MARAAELAKDARAAAPGQLVWTGGTLVAGGTAFVVGGAGVVGAVAAGICLGLGAFVIAAELVALARPRVSTGTRVASLLGGGTAAGAVVVLADGLVTASLPSVVLGAACAAALCGGAIYAEHVIAVEGPTRPAAAAAARLWLPWRDLFLALTGAPLQESPTPPARLPRETR